MGIEMDYGEEAELIIRLLVERGAELGVTHMRGESNYYRHDCDNLPFSKIAHNLWNVEDSVLYVTYEGKTRWLRFIFGNSFGELVGDWSCSRYGEPNKPIDNLIESVLSASWSHKGEEHNKAIRAFGDQYTGLGFKEVTRIMNGSEVYQREVSA